MLMACLTVNRGLESSARRPERVLNGKSGRWRSRMDSLLWITPSMSRLLPRRGSCLMTVSGSAWPVRLAGICR